ncbi:hypothetical protein EDM22_14795 [Agromyces tardus]|jgi:hypothetical protein|uniref:Uncharacterized protein n=1 Tax=Agromyces tardus TaxID=2583849 RepID=A0A3M8A4A6_9MICO|nr:hypothetical protein EDM22_14795 [Agromyces tardus]
MVPTSAGTTSTVATTRTGPFCRRTVDRTGAGDSGPAEPTRLRGRSDVTAARDREGPADLVGVTARLRASERGRSRSRSDWPISSSPLNS